MMGLHLARALVNLCLKTYTFDAVSFFLDMLVRSQQDDTDNTQVDGVPACSYSTSTTLACRDVQVSQGDHFFTLL